jgi:hypothetical protein
MPSPTGTDNLSYCAPIGPRFDSLVTDQFLARVAIRELATQCEKRALITNADKPSIEWIPSGGSFNTSPVGYTGPGADYRTSRIGSRIDLAGDIKDNLSLAFDQFGAQARAVATLIRQQVSRDLWAKTPLPPAPKGMAYYAGQNPNGVILRAGDPITLDDLTELRERITPWSPTAPLVYVMNTRLLRELERLSIAAGAPIAYERDPVTGARTAHWGAYPILACDFIRLDEISGDRGDTTSVYLVRVGTGPDDPDGIAGVSLIVPQGGREIRVSAIEPVASSPNDVWTATAVWDVGLDGGSRGAAVAAIEGLLSPS